MSDITSIIQTATGRKQLHLRRMVLQVVKGPDAGLQMTFESDVITIGTHPSNHIVLNDDTVSRRHAEVVRDRTGILLKDKSSTNGTFLGSVKIREVYLGENRTFRVGKTEIAFTPIDEVVDIIPSSQTHFEQMVGRSVAIREVFSVIERVGPTELTVLITGETGTGKELASRALHRQSRRKSCPFVVFDCGAVARNLIESELFGHERGAFTGAVAARAGVFEQAHGGTIFLDELGELPLELQPALLRVLEQREVRRVGDRRVRPVDVRVIAATNRDLRQQVESGQFRSDLYYRLAVVELELPSLRERHEDLPLLCEHLLSTAPFEHSVKHLAPEVEQRFQQWHWPGNIRELRNTILRALPFCDGDTIELGALPDSLRTLGHQASEAPESPSDSRTAAVTLPSPEMSLKEAREQLLESFEKQYLEELLQRCDGNISQAARIAGVDRKTIARMLKRHSIR